MYKVSIILLIFLLTSKNPLTAQVHSGFKKNYEELIYKEKYALALYKVDSLLKQRDLNTNTTIELTLKKANIFTLLKLHDSAIYYLDKSLASMTKIKDSSGIAKANTNLGILLNQVGKHEDALKKFQSHYKYISQSDKNRETLKRLLIANYNLGLTHFRLNQIDSATYYLNSGLQLAKELNDLYAVSRLKGLQSEVNYKSGEDWKDDLDEALNASLELADSIGILKAYLTKAEFYLTQNDSLSLINLDKASTYIKKTKNLNLLINYEKVKHKLLKKTGDVYGSLESLERYNSYNKELDSIKNTNQVAIYNERLKISDEKLKTTLKLLKTETQIKKLTTLVSVLSILLILSLGYFFLKRKELKFNRKLFKINRIHENKISKTEISTDKSDLFKQIEHELIENELFLNQKVSLSYIADKVNSNSSYVSEVINLFTDTNLRTYINQLRITYAKALINKTIKSKEKINFDHIAEQTGFNSKTHFYRIFKQFVELTPNEYVKFCKEEIDS